MWYIRKRASFNEEWQTFLAKRSLYRLAFIRRALSSHEQRGNKEVETADKIVRKIRNGSLYSLPPRGYCRILIGGTIYIIY